MYVELHVISINLCSYLICSGEVLSASRIEIFDMYTSNHLTVRKQIINIKLNN